MPSAARSSEVSGIPGHNAAQEILRKSVQPRHHRCRIQIGAESRADLLKAVGNPLDPATSIGPMCHAAHGQRVLGYVESALAEGARLVCGGERIAVPGCDGGFFIAPTILADCRPEMRAVREEIFGPVLTVLKYRSDDEAVALANDTHYGLSAGLWTGDVVKAQAIAARLNAGSVWINDWHVLRSDTPFGGFGQSGAGREFGVEGLEAFLETKSVVTAFERDPGKRLMTYAPLFKRFAA